MRRRQALESAASSLSIPRWRSCTCACVQASVAGAVEGAARRGACRSVEQLRARGATIVQNATRVPLPGATRTRRRRAKIGSSTVPDGVGQPLAVLQGRGGARWFAPARRTARGRSRIVICAAMSPSTTAKWAAQICGSPGDRSRRVASSAPNSGRYSVCTNIFANAGWARVGRRRGQHQLGIGGQFDLAGSPAAVGDRHAPDFAVMLAGHDDLQRGRQRRRPDG